MSTQSVTITVKAQAAPPPAPAPMCITVKRTANPVQDKPKPSPIPASNVGEEREVTPKAEKDAEVVEATAKVAPPTGETEGGRSLLKEGEYEKVQELYFFPLEDAKDALYKAFYDDDTAESTLAVLAKRVVARDDALANFFERYHVAEDEAAGKTILPEVKQRLEAECKKYESLVAKTIIAPKRAASSYTKEEIDKMIANADLPFHLMQLGMTANDIKAERIRRNKSYLRKSDRRIGDNCADQLAVAARELHDWGVPITETMQSACAKYGYNIPDEWIDRPDDPAKLEERRIRHAEGNKRSYHKKTEVARALRKAKKEELLKSFEGF